MKYHDPISFSRLLIIGCGGAGKSTLSLDLGEATGLPVTHLDRLYWLPGWQHVDNEVFDERLDRLLAGERWIIDGNFARTLSTRLERCDAVVLLDYPRAVCTRGVLRRVRRNYGHTRPDMGGGCPDRYDLEFLRWVWRYPMDVRPRQLELLRQAAGRPDPPQIFVLRSRRQARRWLRAAIAAVNSTDSRGQTSASV